MSTVPTTRPTVVTQGGKVYVDRDACTVLTLTSEQARRLAADLLVAVDVVSPPCATGGRLGPDQEPAVPEVGARVRLRDFKTAPGTVRSVDGGLAHVAWDDGIRSVEWPSSLEVDPGQEPERHSFEVRECARCTMNAGRAKGCRFAPDNANGAGDQ